jgi:hypothetical protein
MLELTLPPWRLPIWELRWGRFVTHGHSLVWNHWKGPRPLSFVALDGATGEAAEVSETRVVVGGSGAVLEMREPRVLRSGRLGQTALSKIPLVREHLPLRMLQVRETKWLSRAALSVDGATHEGWAVHELVRWP